jgi:hypothetical protein
LNSDSPGKRHDETVAPIFDRYTGSCTPSVRLLGALDGHNRVTAIHIRNRARPRSMA